MEPQNPATKVRPAMLTAIGIVSFVVTCLCIVALLFAIIQSDSITLSAMDERIAHGGSVWIILIVITLLLLLLKVWGVVRMLNLKRSGYVMYMIPGSIYILLGLMSLLTLGSSIFATADGIVSFIFWIGTFIFMYLYGRTLKHMK